MQFHEIQVGQKVSVSGNGLVGEGEVLAKPAEGWRYACHFVQVSMPAHYSTNPHARVYWVEAKHLTLKGA